MQKSPFSSCIAAGNDFLPGNRMALKSLPAVISINIDKRLFKVDIDSISGQCDRCRACFYYLNIRVMFL